jgi:NADP-dependent 3-hydroxy acid dehydrogenase YdfG/acyl carrier protein
VSLLAPNGRFLELGKVDFFENTRLGLTAFSRGLAFFGVDLQTLLENDPEVASGLFSELIEMLQAGTLQPLPLRTYPISEASDAFRFMAQGRHVGKIALSLRADPGPIVRVEPAAQLFRGDATYLITGGLSGFGLAMAEWMMQEGATHFVLAGRRGVAEPDAQAAVARLQVAGATVVAAKADVTREEDVVALIDHIRRSMPPLRGVLHAAMVLDDDYLLQLDAGRFRRVTAPKAIGALNLHRCTLDSDLDCFVMFSSIASIKGWPGQGNYAAGNSFLDGLAHYRRAMNLPALTVSWGVISEVGYVARHRELSAELERQGLRPISPREAGLIIGRSLRNRDIHVAAGRIDFERLQIKGASEAVSRRFSLVLDGGNGSAAGPAGSARAAVVDLLRASPPEQRHEVAEGALRADLARVLGVRESQIDSDQPLSNLGVDSLMSVELETVVKSTFGVSLPLGFLLSQDATLRSLSRRLADQVTSANE